MPPENEETSTVFRRETAVAGSQPAVNPSVDGALVPCHLPVGHPTAPDRARLSGYRDVAALLE